MDNIQPQQNRPPQATGYTNLSQYVNANQNNQLGNAVGGGIQQAGQAATGAINTAGQQFQQAAGTEQQRLSGLGQGVQTAIGDTGTTLGANDVSNVQSALSGQGQGPSGLANAGQLTQQAQSAQQQGQATGSELGRFGLLQSYVGKGQQYGLGQQTLDSAILGQTGQQQLGQARTATAGLGQQANRAIAAANAQGQQLQNQAQQLKTNTQNQLGQAVTGYDQSMQQKVASDQAAQQALIQQLSGQGSNAAINLDPALLANLSTASGGVLTAGKDLYNADLSPYLQGNTNNLNAQGVQGASDFSKIQALSQLAGNTGLAGTPQSSILQNYITNPTAVGAYDPNNPLTISSQSGLNDAINTAANNYQTTISTPQSNLQSLQQALGGGVNNMGSVQQVQQELQAAYQNSPDYQKYLSSSPSANESAPAIEDVTKWAQQAVNSQNPSNLGKYNTQQQLSGFLNQIQADQSALSQNQAALTAAGPQFNILRTLQANNPSAPTVSANPILGNNGQPLSV
jgi:hypothetical protein